MKSPEWIIKARALIQSAEGMRPAADWRRVGAKSLSTAQGWLSSESKAGRAFPARVSAKYTRYFGTMAEADAYLAAEGSYTPTVTVKAAPISKHAKVDASRAKVTICPPFVDRRYTPDLDERGRVPGGFQEMGPGRYLGPA